MNYDFTSDPKVGANRYILFGLIQRLEEIQPNIINEWIEGVKSDRSASNPPENKEHIDAVFNEALKILERAKALSELDNNES